VDFGENDITVTDKISGTDCTIINTPYVKEQTAKLKSVKLSKEE
jgi:nitronate monooxygenase